MKLKFLKTTAVGAGWYSKGQVVDIKDQHAAEVYIAHGQAVAVEGTSTGATLKREFSKATAPAAANSQSAMANGQPNASAAAE